MGCSIMLFSNIIKLYINACDLNIVVISWLLGKIGNSNLLLFSYKNQGVSDKINVEKSLSILMRRCENVCQKKTNGIGGNESP